MKKADLEKRIGRLKKKLGNAGVTAEDRASLLRARTLKKRLKRAQRKMVGVIRREAQTRPPGKEGEVESAPETA